MTPTPTGEPSLRDLLMAVWNAGISAMEDNNFPKLSVGEAEAAILAIITDAKPEKKKVETYKSASKSGRLEWYYQDIGFNQGTDLYEANLLSRLQGNTAGKME